MLNQSIKSINRGDVKHCSIQSDVDLNIHDSGNWYDVFVNFGARDMYDSELCAF